MADQATYEQLVAAQAASRQQLATMAVGYATSSAAAFSAWYDDAKVAAWAQQLANVVQALQRQTAALTDAYLTRLASTMTGRPLAPAGAVDVTALRKSTTPVQVYSRVAETYRYAVSQGADGPKALVQAAQRADILADTDVALAARAQSQRFMIVHRVDGFRRVIHPELARGGTCGLCVAAADNVYHRDQLMPLHARCGCTTAPIINGVDPGHQMNRADLDALYQAAGGTQAPSLTKVRYVVHDSGELGPVLAVHGQHFRGPADIPAA